MRVKKILILTAILAVCFAFVPFFGGFVAKAETDENSGGFETVDGEAVGMTEIPSTATPSVGEADSSLEEGAFETDVIPETEESVWFKEKILPYIVEYGAAALGVFTAVLLSLKKLRVTIADLVGAYNALKKSNKDNESLSEGVNTFKADVREWQEETLSAQREFMTAQRTEMQAFMTAQKEAMEKGFQQIASTVVDKLDDTCKTAHKILDVEELAFEENPALVSNGTSKKIAEVIHNGEETKIKR